MSKWAILFFMCLQLQSELDLTIPEQPIVHIPEEKFLQFNFYREPPTKAQMVTFWTLNALDIITTYEGLKALPNAVERNFLYPDRPSLVQLIIGKAIIGSVIGNNFDKDSMYYVNGQLGVIVVYNYSLYN